MHEGFDLYGLVYDVNVFDDPMVRQLVLADVLERETILDQRLNRLAPIELSILTIGYSRDGKIIHSLPPQPPVNLDSLIVCTEAELQAFTENLTYLRLVLNTPHIPADELLVVNLIRAAGTRPLEWRYPFLLKAGRELARLLNADLMRLESILKRIRSG